MKKFVVLILLLFLLVGCGNKNEMKAGIVSVTCSKALDLQVDGATIIDVRTKEEYDEDHLENAINIPYDVIDKEIADYVDDYDSKIIVYCKSGVRSNKAANTLINMGYKNVYDLGSISNCS